MVGTRKRQRLEARWRLERAEAHHRMSAHEEPVCVEEVEVVKADHWLLLGHSTETILVDEYDEILYMTQISVENLPIVRNQRLTLCTSLFSYGLKSRSALPRMCIRRTRQ